MPSFFRAEHLLEHPLFDQVHHRFVDELVDLFADMPRLKGLGEYRQSVCFQFLVCFDAARDPTAPSTLFTIEQVVEAMAAMGVVERRAVEELVRRLRADGYATVRPAVHDARVKELRATEKALEIDRKWLAFLHRPLTVLDPNEVRYALGASLDSIYHKAFRCMSLRTVDQGSEAMSANPQADYFVRQTQGGRIMMALIQAVRGREDRRTDPGSYAKAAAKCGVSAPHVRKVLSGARDQGWISLSGDRAVVVEVTPEFEGAVQRWTASCLSAADATSRLAWPVYKELKSKALRENTTDSFR